MTNSLVYNFLKYNATTTLFTITKSVQRLLFLCNTEKTGFLKVAKHIDLLLLINLYK